jgi:hypothetical protein
MENLKSILIEAMRGYAGKGLNGVGYLTSDDSNNFYAVVTIGDVRGKTIFNAGLIAQIENEQIIILNDISNKPLVDALEQAGIPREKIVLAYVGEMAKTVS